MRGKRERDIGRRRKKWRKRERDIARGEGCEKRRGRLMRYRGREGSRGRWRRAGNGC